MRFQYRAFESDLRSGASEVYLHEMPGGQFTNLKEQARSLGLESRWHEVARAYAEANQLFGDIVKVTPSSKVVGDMALMMVTQELSRRRRARPGARHRLPGFRRADDEGRARPAAGRLAGGDPEEGAEGRGADHRPPRLAARRRPISTPSAKTAAEKIGHAPDDRELASYLMYPKVFSDFAAAQESYGPTEVLPTPTYFYGLPAGEEISVELEKGKTLVVRCQAIGEPDEEGEVRVFFELNGQPRIARVPDRAHGAGARARRPKAEPGNPAHVAAPMPGVVSGVSVAAGQDDQRRRRAPLHRGDEDGDRAPRRPRRKDRRGAGQGRRPDRREGPAAYPRCEDKCL